MDKPPVPGTADLRGCGRGLRYEEWRRLDRPRKALYTYLMLKNCGNVIALSKDLLVTHCRSDWKA